MSAPAVASAFETGSQVAGGRYRIVRRLGEGGMGVVYEAFDRDRAAHIALKTLLGFDADGLYRFKHEFRTLADLHHHNLVHLYELVAADDGRTVFTMELVHGVDFVTYVRADDRKGTSRRPRDAVASLPPRTREQDTLRPGKPNGAPMRPDGKQAPDPDRMRAALRQLVEGVAAIHAAGKLHRDLKPSNVLVTQEGRVVILDFGVATELHDIDAWMAEGSGETVGTLRYMAPEQIDEGRRLSPASDWYSVGVMLYEALVGRPPFTGAAHEVLTLKSNVDPVAPSACVQSVPPDLDALCTALLRREPEERPSGDEILRRLGATRSSAPPAATPRGDPDAMFIGREGQLAVLRDALDATRSGTAVTVRLSGGPGMGKSTLAHRFLDALVHAGEATVLRGRAYEREEIPYKAIDTLVDALSRHLLQMFEADEPLLLPEGISALAQMFPVLRRVPPIAGRADEGEGDPQTFRARAFAAARALLAQLAERRPLALFIDDAQWGDVDSAMLLLDVLRPPANPPLLLLMTHRDNPAAAASPFLALLREQWPEGVDARDLAVGPLSNENAYELALALLGADDVLSRRTARAVARESLGNPFLIEELARDNQGHAGPEGDTLDVVSLERMVGQRLDRLPGDARRVAEIIAVAGRPVPPSVIGTAAGVEERITEVIGLVCSRRFGRLGMRDGRDVVEAMHDRLREAVVTVLPPATLRTHNERLATALEGRPDADPDTIASHLLLAGLTDRAKPYACAAADQALAAHAYDRALRLYDRALSLGLEGPTKRALQAGRAQALASAGRVEQAAPAFLEAARGADLLHAIDLKRQAAEQFVMAANFDAANETLSQVLGSVGLRMPASRFSLIVLLLVFRLVLRIRGLSTTLRAEESIPRADLVRLDACSSVARLFGVTDPILGAYFQVRALLLALRAGEAFRIAYALGLEGAYLAVDGVATRRKVDQTFALSAEVGERGGHRPRIERSVLPAFRSFAAVVQGRADEALELSDRAAKAILTVGPGMYWALRAVQLNALWALADLGRLDELSCRLERIVAEAVACGDVWTATTLRTGGSFTLAWLGKHTPDEIRAWVAEGIQRWTRRVYHNQHAFAAWTLVVLDLYEGKGRAAYDRMAPEFVRSQRALKFKMEVVHTQARFLRGRAALLAAAQSSGHERRRLLAVARGDARWLWGKGPVHTHHQAAALDAGIADVMGERDRCLAALRDTVERARAARHSLGVAAAQVRLGGLLGDTGEGTRQEGEAFLRSQGVADPARMARMLVPLADPFPTDGGRERSAH
jgi:eukaryotic-like serine/threonine-protein kinase